jgi:hypothetical protein
MKKYWPHISAAIIFAWTYLQPGILQMVEALAAKHPQATVLSILAGLIGMYHLTSPKSQARAEAK